MTNDSIKPLIDIIKELEEMDRIGNCFFTPEQRAILVEKTTELGQLTLSFLSKNLEGIKNNATTSFR